MQIKPQVDPHNDPSSTKSEESQNKTCDCSYVLPSSEILGGYKQMEASQAELKLAYTFYGKKVQTEVNYFDPTTKISIGGEWQSLILVHSDGQ